MHFGENQLSRSLIGLSPLSTAHPPSFQPRWVRSSTRSYTCFNLAMDRSLRFGSRSCHYNALFRLAFATTTPHGLISRRNTNSQAHSSKGTLSPQKAPTACKHTVSGTISLPSRGTFHHSLTVLIRYRSSGSIQAYQVVLADSHEISRAPCYSGTTSRHSNHDFVYGTHTPYGLALTTSSTTTTPQRPGWRPQEQRIPQPRSCNPRQVSHTTGLATIRFRSPLLTESLLFSLPMGTEMFHFPTFLLAPYEFRYE